jgi:hypothetical protein
VTVALASVPPKFGDLQNREVVGMVGWVFRVGFGWIFCEALHERSTPQDRKEIQDFESRMLRPFDSGLGQASTGVPLRCRPVPLSLTTPCTTESHRAKSEFP